MPDDLDLPDQITRIAERSLLRIRILSIPDGPDLTILSSLSGVQLT